MRFIDLNQFQENYMQLTIVEHIHVKNIIYVYHFFPI